MLPLIRREVRQKAEKKGEEGRGEGERKGGKVYGLDRLCLV